MQLDLFETLPSDVTKGVVCVKCKLLKPITSYTKASGGNYYRTECRSCANELSHIRSKLRAEKGEPPSGYVCPICEEDESSVKGSGNKRNGSWVLDHCHLSQAFRGWLCHKCNRGLGAFEDNPTRLENAITYLRKHDE